MALLRGFEKPDAYRGGYVSIGNFDGVHLGHQSMIASLVERARSAAVPAVVLSFDPHPVELLRPASAPPQLTTLERKAELLGGCGVDCVIAYPTDTSFLSLAPDEFFERFVRGQLAASGLVEGPNFRFGRHRAGDIAALSQLCDAAGITLDVTLPVCVGDMLVSSTAVRRLIGAGQVDQAVALLGRPYGVSGEVVGGAERGQSIGFPTANLDGVPTMLPADGVYAGAARSGGRSYPSAIHLGRNPTFDDSRRKFEVHLIDFSGNLYDQTLDVDFYVRLRDTQAFSSPRALQDQIERDIEQTRAAAAKYIAG